MALAGSGISDRLHPCKHHASAVWPSPANAGEGHVSVSKKSFRHAEAFFRPSKSSEKCGSSSCRTPFPGFPHTPFRPVDVPRRPQAVESKPQPPLMGGAAGRSPQGGTKPPSPGRHRAASPGRWEGCGAGGPLAPRAAAGTSPPEDYGTGTGAGQGRAAAMGRGRPGRASTGPACTRPAAYISGPARHLRGRAGHRHGGGPGRRALCARDSGRAEGPRGGRIRTRSDGVGCCRSGTGWGGGGTDRSRGRPSRSWGGVGGKKNGRGACPPAGHDWTKKKCGEDALSPPLAVTADTRYPPVRRSSPKRIRCRPVPYALAVRRLPGLWSCVP